MVFSQTYEELCHRAGQTTNSVIKNLSNQIQHERVFLLKDAHRINSEEEWGHILAALKSDNSIEKISIINSRFKVDPSKGVKILPIISTNKTLIINILKTLKFLLKNNLRLNSIELSGLNTLNHKALNEFLPEIEMSRSLKALIINRCPIEDQGAINICKALQNVPDNLPENCVNHPLEYLNLSRCSIGDSGLNAISSLIALQKTRRENLLYNTLWKFSLRDKQNSTSTFSKTTPKNSKTNISLQHQENSQQNYQKERLFIPNKLSGLIRISLTANIAITDDAVINLTKHLNEDVFLHALDLQSLPKLTKRSGEVIFELLNSNSEISKNNFNRLPNKRNHGTSNNLNLQQLANSAISVFDIRGCDNIERDLIRKITTACVRNSELFLPLSNRINFATDNLNQIISESIKYNDEISNSPTISYQWQDASEIGLDAEYLAISGFGNKFNLTKQQLDIFNKKDSKLKSLKADFLVEKELRKSTERKLANNAEEIKHLRKKVSSLQEEIFSLGNNIVVPEGKCLMDNYVLENIESTFSKFNTFLEALGKLGITNTEKLHKADVGKIQDMLDDL